MKDYLLTTIHNTYITKPKRNYFSQQKIAGICTSVHNIQLKQQQELLTCVRIYQALKA